MSTISITNALKIYFGNEFSDNDYQMFLKMKNRGALQIFPCLLDGKNSDILDLQVGVVDLKKNSLDVLSFERMNRSLRKCKIMGVIFLDDDADKFAELMDNSEYNYCVSVTKAGKLDTGCDMLIKYKTM